MSKKNIFAFLVFCLTLFLLSGCSLFPSSSPQQPLAVPAEEEPKQVSEDSSADIPESPAPAKEAEIAPLEKFIASLNGETVITLVAKAEAKTKELDAQLAAATTKEEKEKILSIEQSGYPQTENDCLKQTEEYYDGLKDSDKLFAFTEEQISESPIIGDGEYGARYDLNCSLALEKYENCLLENRGSSEKIFYQKNFASKLAKSLAARFSLGLAIRLKLSEDPSWCQSLEDEAGKSYCLGLNEDKLAGYLLDYYKISGVIPALKEKYGKLKLIGYQDYEFNGEETREYALKKIESWTAMVKAIMSGEDDAEEPKMPDVLPWVEPIGGGNSDGPFFGALDTISDLNSKTVFVDVVDAVYGNTLAENFDAIIQRVKELRNN